MADANEQRDWRIHAEFAQGLITTARRLQVNHSLDIERVPEPGAIHVMDRNCLDFERLYHFHCEGAFFFLCTKKNLRVRPCSCPAAG